MGYGKICDGPVVDAHVVLMDPRARLPKRATPGSSGYDLYPLEEVTLLPGTVTAVSSGVAMAVPTGYEIQVRPRSGMSLKLPQVRVANAPGTVDSDYRDEIRVLFHNMGDEPVTLPADKAMAQLVVQRVETLAFRVLDEWGTPHATGRMYGGFGSTDETTVSVKE